MGRFGVARVITGGLSVSVIGYLLILPIGLDSDYLTVLGPSFTLIGLGFGLTYGPLAIAATSDIAPHEQGLAGGLVQTSFQFGGALVLAVVVAVNDANTVADGTAQGLLDGYRAALLVPLAAVVLGVIATGLGLRRPTSGTTGTRLSPPGSAESTHAGHRASTASRGALPLYRLGVP